MKVVVTCPGVDQDVPGLDVVVRCAEGLEREDVGGLGLVRKRVAESTDQTETLAERREVVESEPERGKIGGACGPLTGAMMYMRRCTSAWT